MRTLQITSKKELNLKEWSKRTALENDYSILVKDDVLVVDGNGKPLILYMQLKDWDFTPLRAILNRIQYQQSERTGGLKTISRVFGYQPRIALRRDFCTATSLAYEDSQANEVVCGYGRKIDPIYRNNFPEVAATHEAQTLKVLSEWRIPGTVFTSGIINKNNPLKYHFDAGNFTDVCSCMLGLRRDVVGGHLAVPELDMAFEIADGSLTIFDGQSLLHGVTPLRRLTPTAYRYTIVYYALKAMWNCEPLEKEVARIRQKRTERERKRAGLATTIHTPEVGKEIYTDQNGQVHEGKKDE